MSQYTINDLRSELFSTLKMLKDEKNPMDLERAKAITDVAQVIINSAKVEVDHIRAVGSGDTGFIPRATPPALPPASTGEPMKLPNGTEVVAETKGATVTRHTLR